jgi:uroporphyrinogen-III synthase
VKSGAQPVVVIVTRPDDAGRRLAGNITQRGIRAVWWPAFEIAAAPDTEAARSALARLSDYDLALFVSPNAVRAAAALLGAYQWPRGTMIGAVGASTRAAVEAELRPADVAVIAPDEEGGSGSEAFWRAWQARSPGVKRVLLLRAQSGRDWLMQRFVESGAVVDVVAVYTRRRHRLSAADVAQLREWIAAGVTPAIVFSSSEAVAALDQQADADARRWLRSGTAIATHSRIAQQLAADGYARVIGATLDDDAIIAKLESIRGSR